MKTPICELCIRSSTLCDNCSEKMTKGEITQRDIEISRYLDKLEKKLLITDVEFVKSHELDSFILIIADGRISSLIGKRGKIVRMMSEEFNKKIRVIGLGDIKSMAQDLISPARVFGVNILYTPEGERYNVVIPKNDKRKIFMDEDTLKKAVSTLFGKEVNIKFT